MTEPGIDVYLSYKEITLLRQRLNVQYGSASLGPVDSVLDAKLYRAQKDLEDTK